MTKHAICDRTSAVMAVMLGALMIHGITPTPRLITDNADLFWGLVVSFLLGNAILLVFNIPMIGVWVRLLQIPYTILYPIILAFICIGVYSINSSVFDIYLVLLFGLMGYLFDKAVSHETHVQMMADVDTKFDHKADQNTHKILNQAMYDVAQALGHKNVKLAPLH